MRRRKAKPAPPSAALLPPPPEEANEPRDYPRLTWGGYAASLKDLVQVEGAFEADVPLEWDEA